MTEDEGSIRVSALDSEQPSLADRIGGDTHNVLLLAPPMDGCDGDGCIDLLTVEPPDGEDVLFVTFVESPDERLETWRSRAGNAPPAKIGFVNVADATRSAAAASQPTGGARGGLSIRSVSSPGNLTDLGIEVSRYLSEWDGDGNRTVVCFHSLTTLLQYVDLQRAFRFFHVLTGRVRATDGLAHYHMDPSAHDERTINTLKTLFDGVAEWDGAGWQIRNR